MLVTGSARRLTSWGRAAEASVSTLVRRVDHAGHVVAASASKPNEQQPPCSISRLSLYDLGHIHFRNDLRLSLGIHFNVWYDSGTNTCVGGCAKHRLNCN